MVRRGLDYSAGSSNKIIDDKIVSRKEFEPFYVYMTYMNFWRRNFESFRKNNIKGEDTEENGDKKKSNGRK